MVVIIVVEFLTHTSLDSDLPCVSIGPLPQVSTEYVVDFCVIFEVGWIWMTPTLQLFGVNMALPRIFVEQGNSWT
jgi:hypothetical protein